ncbi:MAG: hypothetical protein GXP62_05505 [Oligoflexia bacterium]|nr:hypothetical protein [Oligoflexia bacterium]
MARSLTVKNDEVPATSPLFTAFLLLALAWMAISAATTVTTEGPVPDAATLYGE